ncbi:hypothetical protein IKG12_01095 [Candidatus Saccharibacteria bacterium]|nr:hypothetical protein [Candidatus Saccharibacteria bacterium]
MRSSFDSTGSLGARSYPLSYVKSGVYYWELGRLYHQTLESAYWSSSIYDGYGSYRLVMNDARLIEAGANNKRYGFTLHCVVDSILTSSHNAEETHFSC